MPNILRPVGIKTPPKGHIWLVVKNILNVRFVQNMRKHVGSDEGSKAGNYTRTAVEYNSLCM